jgi:uncharacterized membrane protein
VKSAIPATDILTKLMPPFFIIKLGIAGAEIADEVAVP